MLEIRLTILRDKPASDSLRKYASAGYYLFQDKQTNLYFLTKAKEGRFPRSVFWSGYDRLLNIPSDFDCSYLKAFEANHKDHFVDSMIHEDVLIDAISLSHEFSTRVLCVYSNDEACDFAATAENGQLLRLRFQVDSRQGERLPNDVAEGIETEIHATRIIFDDEEPSDDGVFEYTGYEAIQTSETPLLLQPYWRYYEGEIKGQAVFRTISSTPDNVSPHLLFRNAILEFEEAFGQTPPDFTDIPETDRYELVDFQDPPKISLFERLFNFLKSLVMRSFNSPKAMMVTVIMSIILWGAVFGDRTEQTKKQKIFSQYCSSAGGIISGEKQNSCLVNNVSYQNWNLPGENGERRPLILNIGPQKIPCPNTSEKYCLVIDGQVFPFEIEGFTFNDGKEQTVAVIRSQNCDLKAPDDCPKEGPLFEYKQMISIEK